MEHTQLEEIASRNSGRSALSLAETLPWDAKGVELDSDGWLERLDQSVILDDDLNSLACNLTLVPVETPIDAEESSSYG
jgi:hypothetical protein